MEEMIMSNRTEQTMSMFGIVTLAAVAGAVAALLTAPRKGSDTRDQLMDKMKQARQKSMEAMDSAKSKAQDATDKVKGKADEAATNAQDAVTEARSQVEDVAADVGNKQRSRRSVTPL
jgi:gas vesicle protein